MPTRRWKSLAAVIPLLALNGCVFFPHGECVAPPATGRVLRASDGQPIAGARVTRRIEAFGREATARTDAQGAFAFRRASRVSWLPSVCYAASPIDYRVEAAGFQPFSTNLLGGGSFSDGLRPHDLGPVLLRPRD